MSLWKSENIEAKVINILQNINTPDSHHFGRPFVSAYQLAIDFEKNYPDTVNKLGLEMGGKGSGLYKSLPQYLALQISKHISTLPLEASFLCSKYVDEFRFNYDHELVSSLNDSQYGLSMFRLKERLLPPKILPSASAVNKKEKTSCRR